MALGGGISPSETAVSERAERSGTSLTRGSASPGQDSLGSWKQAAALPRCQTLAGVLASRRCSVAGAQASGCPQAAALGPCLWRRGDT